MITGRQIRTARELLGLSVGSMAQRSDLEASTINRAEAIDAEPAITLARAGRIPSMFEKRGIVFDRDGVGVSRRTAAGR